MCVCGLEFRLQYSASMQSITACYVCLKWKAHFVLEGIIEIELENTVYIF